MAHTHEGCQQCSKLNLLNISAGHDSREHEVLHKIESETGLEIADPHLAKLLIDALAQYPIEDITELVIFTVFEVIDLIKGETGLDADNPQFAKLLIGAIAQLGIQNNTEVVIV